MMKFWIGVTDDRWYEFLSRQDDLEEVNFWQPGGGIREDGRERGIFKTLTPGELFLFKLHSPRNVIAGGGFFRHATRLPLSTAWQLFDKANGAATLGEVRTLIGRKRSRPLDHHEDPSIGCILLNQPFFLPADRWIPVPRSWAPNIVSGKSYPLDSAEGREVWRQLQSSLLDSQLVSQDGRRPDHRVEDTERYASPVLVSPRLGQGTFRAVIIDTYQRRCAVTRERTLPALEAAHIRPYSEGGDHRADNGLLLRRDLHSLFDQGYLTITPQFRLEVSRKIREEYENGRDYYALQGREVFLPTDSSSRPSAEFLRWHNERFKS